MSDARLVPSHENDLKLAEIIGMCMGAMTPEGCHAVLCAAVLKHQCGIKGQRCETCANPPGRRR